ncbi:MAG: UDP-2,3-diacylglucosamine diphosphatase [Phycisphaerales bacterium]
MSLRINYRTVFLSDVHLGSAASRADAAAEFLKHLDCQTLYLVGDIIDMWRLRSRWHWPESHNRFVRRVLKMAKRGTRVVFIPGNHDDHAREYVGLNFGGVELAREAVHQTADGRRLLVVHGDEVDAVVRHARLLSVIGGAAYDQLVLVNRWSNRIRSWLGLRPWSLSQAVKMRVKKACQHIARFEQTLADEAAARALHGVVCGHIHKAESRRIGAAAGPEVEYHNCGDWVESCTALVEHDDGTLRLLDGLAMIEQWRGLEAAESDAPTAYTPL